MRFCQNEVQNQVRIFWQNLTFWAATFFQMSLENFLYVLRQLSRYLRGPLSLALCVSKKIVIIRHTNKKILAKTAKKPFCMTSLGTTVAFLDDEKTKMKNILIYDGIEIKTAHESFRNHKSNYSFPWMKEKMKKINQTHKENDIFWLKNWKTHFSRYIFKARASPVPKGN